ncbi:MAG: DUF885 domain-containing protein [Candidatus Melainabacteria bacterium]|nr:DUF885 domain-containing protein [Candidatus Melainabacteria bacterium]
MNRNFSASLLVAATCLIGILPGRAADASLDADKKFATLSEQFMKESLARSPGDASEAGYHVHKDATTGKTLILDAMLDDMSLDFMKQQRDFYQQWRDRFAKETPPEKLDPQDSADWHLLDDQIAVNLLELDKIQNYKHNPTVVVELLGSALFQPMTASYANKPVRLGHVLDRIQQIPRLLEQVKVYLDKADPIFVKTAIEENDGNVDLIETTVKNEITDDGKLKDRYNKVAPVAVAALKDFSKWLEEDLGQRPNPRSWRLGKEMYDAKFKLIMETGVTPEQLLKNAESTMKEVRADMLSLSLPMHKIMYPDHNEHTDKTEHERENIIIGEVLQRISDEHPHRDDLQQTIEDDLEGIKEFIRANKIVALSDRDNLKVIPTPKFMRGIYSGAGFHSAPPLEPKSEAQYWITPIDPKTADEKAESRLRENNNYSLKWLTIHEALPGHYIQFEHLNNIQPERRRLLRSLFSNGAYVEGWAEYIAQVMMDEGFMKNEPKFRLTMRKIRLRLLANTIMDVRNHTMDFSDGDAMRLMTEDCFQTQAEAEAKLKRAKLSSTQLPTYYAGLVDWLALREKYQKAKGKDFDLLKFHNLVLDQGPLPVPVVEKLILDQAN